MAEAGGTLRTARSASLDRGGQHSTSSGWELLLNVWVSNLPFLESSPRTTTRGRPANRVGEGSAGHGLRSRKWSSLSAHQITLDSWTLAFVGGALIAVE